MLLVVPFAVDLQKRIQRDMRSEACVRLGLCVKRVVDVWCGGCFDKANRNCEVDHHSNLTRAMEIFPALEAAASIRFCSPPRERTFPTTMVASSRYLTGINYPSEHNSHVDAVCHRGPSIGRFRHRCVVPAEPEQSAQHIDAHPD